MSSSGYQGKS